MAYCSIHDWQNTDMDCPNCDDEDGPWAYFDAIARYRTEHPEPASSGNSEIVSCAEYAALVREVSYPRRNKEAHDAAFDEHERLMADGWEVLGNQELTATHWKMRYCKRN